jgi:hypothetical protein
MERFHDEFLPYQHALREVSSPELERVLLMVYTRFCAKHPEDFRLLLAEGAADSERSRWLVEKHLRCYRNFYNCVGERGEIDKEEVEAISALAFTGAAATIFAVPALCRSLFVVQATDARTETLVVHVKARVGVLLPGLIREVTAELEKAGRVTDRYRAAPLPLSIEMS